MVKAMLEGELPEDLKAALTDWLEHVDDSEGTRERAEALTAVLEKYKDNCDKCAALYDEKQFFVKRSHWIFGGDGWAYDIGYGGLDHVYWHPARMSMLWYSIPRYIPTPAVNPPNLLRLRQSLNLLPAAKRPRRKTLA